MTAPDPNPFAGIPCRDCGASRLRLEWRDVTTFAAMPFGTYSLAGVQAKVSALSVVTPHPWCVCDRCGAESKGKSD